MEPQLPSTPASAAQILCDDPSAPAFGVLVNHSLAPASYTLSSWFGHCLVCPLVGPCLCSPTVNRCLHCPWVSSAVPCSLSAAQLACALSSLPSPPPGSLSASLMKPAPGAWSLTLVTSAPWPFSSDSRQRSAPGSLLPALVLQPWLLVSGATPQLPDFCPEFKQCWQHTEGFCHRPPEAFHLQRWPPTRSPEDFCPLSLQSCHPPDLLHPSVLPPGHPSCEPPPPTCLFGLLAGEQILVFYF